MNRIAPSDTDSTDTTAVTVAPPIDITTYYTEAGMDYRAWSRGFNMHFGFWRWPMNPFALEAMLEAVEDVSWRIAPSVLHVPRVTLKFLAGELLLRRRWLNRTRWNNVIACVLAPIIGLGRAWFGYYLVTARKR